MTEQVKIQRFNESQRLCSCGSGLITTCIDMPEVKIDGGDVMCSHMQQLLEDNNEFDFKRLYCDECGDNHPHFPTRIFPTVNKKFEAVKKLFEEISADFEQSFANLDKYFPTLEFLKEQCEKH